MQVRSLGQENALEKEMATHFSILAWRIPWRRSLVGCSPWSHSCKESDTTEHLYQFSSVQFSSVAQSCLHLCDPMNHSTPGLPVHHQLPEFTQTHVHRVSDTIQPSHPLLSPFPPAPNPSHICRAAVATQTYRTDLWTPGERRGWDKLREQH